MDICAPGVDVYSCYAGDGHTYGKLSGTSMASPMVAAIAALTWSVNPALTGAQVRSIVLSYTSYNVADNPDANSPLTNTYRMVNAKLSVEAAIATLAAAKVNNQETVTASPDSLAQAGDIITFGFYPQTKVTTTSLISKLNLCTPDADNAVTYANAKYKKVSFTAYTPYYTGVTASAANSYQDDNGYLINTVYWFKYEPIQWRVLSNTNGELFVMSEKILDAQAFNQTLTGVSWETSTLRTWLNNDFYNAAFSTDDKSKIVTSSVVNDDNPLFGTEGGNNTSDKLFLLSIGESTNTSYGFNSGYNTYDAARQAQGTDFSRSKGIYEYASNSYTGNSYWWLRSPGEAVLNEPTRVSFNSGSGGGCDDGYVDTCLGVRPVLKLSLSSIILTSSAGSGCVVDSGNRLIYGLDTGITKAQFESNYVQIIGNGRLVYTPAAGVLGTGTTVELVNNLTSQVIAAYRIIIFGDVDGDGYADGNDASITGLIAAGMLTQSAAGNLACIAADANHDGVIDALDAQLLESSGLMLANISQIP